MSAHKNKHNICIIGSGIIGLCLAKSLLKKGHKNIAIIEKESTIGAHASGRNSGVLHAGIYYPSNSLKAQFCLKGNHYWQQFCIDHQLPLRKAGKVLVCQDHSEIDTLHQLHSQSQENGAKTEILTPKELTNIEPFAKTIEAALWSPETAVIDPKAILQCLYQQLSDSTEVTFYLNETVTQVTNTQLHTKQQCLNYQFLINAAGAYSDQIAHSLKVGTQYRFVPFKGTYRKLTPTKAQDIRCNIYPVPNLKNPFLGVHFTKAVHGDVYIGPTAIPAFGPENYGLFDNLGTHSLKILGANALLFFKNKKFRTLALTEPKAYIDLLYYRQAKKLVQSLNAKDMHRSNKIGIRPQLVNWNTKELVMDFVIEQGPNSVHILNAISPAFTSAPEFADYVIDKHL